MAKPNGKEANVLLAVDVGNTQTSLGAFSDGALLATWTLTTPERLTADEAFETAFSALERMARRASFDVRNRATGVDASVRETSSAGALSLEPDLVDDAVISCVVPDLAAPWQEALRRLAGRRPLTVGPGIKTGVRMKYRDPAEIGADRMADLAALLADYAPPATRPTSRSSTPRACFWEASSRRAWRLARALWRRVRRSFPSSRSRRPKR